MQKITMQILASNELDLGASAAPGGFKGEVRYATGQHAGELIIRTKRAFPTKFAAINAMGAVVKAAKELADPSMKIEPLSEIEYAEELKRQFREDTLKGG